MQKLTDWTTYWSHICIQKQEKLDIELADNKKGRHEGARKSKTQG